MNRTTHIMRFERFNTCLAGALLAASLSTPLMAGPGHDHNDAPQAPGTAASPRFEAVSDAFELVGILDGRRLALYLDRAEDNSPVANARLEVELGGTRLTLSDGGDGVFEAELGAAPAHGVTAVTAMVTIGRESDLLAGELDIHEEEHPVEVSASWVSGPYATAAGIGIGSVALLVPMAWAARRLTARNRTGDAK